MKANVLLAQTDTTVGFLSQDAGRLVAIKKRPPAKPFLKVFATLAMLRKHQLRIPMTHRRRVRNAKRTTFIVKGQAFRIVAAGPHHHLLKKAGWYYSTSANESGHGYAPAFCTANADIIAEDARGLFEAPPSAIVKLGRTRQRRVR